MTALESLDDTTMCSQRSTIQIEQNRFDIELNVLSGKSPLYNQTIIALEYNFAQMCGVGEQHACNIYWSTQRQDHPYVDSVSYNNHDKLTDGSVETFHNFRNFGYSQRNELLVQDSNDVFYQYIQMPLENPRHITKIRLYHSIGPYPTINGDDTHWKLIFREQLNDLKILIRGQPHLVNQNILDQSPCCVVGSNQVNLDTLHDAWAILYKW